METNDQSQDTSFEGKVAFIDHHLPVIAAGKYTVTVRQDAHSESSESSKEFVVAAPRFSLGADLIHSHFPPNGGNAVYDGTIPAIGLQRNTLPWERSPTDPAQGFGGNTPWLALILITEDEMANGSARELTRDLGAVKDRLGISNLTDWVLYRDDLPLQILELNNDLYQAIVPAYGDLQLLAHCRQNHTGAGGIQDELAYVLGNRLPTPDQINTVYLVSLEQRYADDAPASKAALQAGETQQLVWLYKWQFSCQSAQTFNYVVTAAILQQAKQEYPAIGLPASLPSWVEREFEGETGKERLKDLLMNGGELTNVSKTAVAFILRKSKRAGGTFNHILESIDSGSLRDYPHLGETITNPKADQLLSTGRTVLKHHLRSGGKTFSWFKGPLSAVPETDKGFRFPVNTGDELLIFDRATGMFDTTYAAAWSLGRLKGLEEKRLSTSLFRWRHKQLHARGGTDASHLPQATSSIASFPENVARQLDNWKLLKDLPFDYLIPKPSLLPRESLRFFYLDPNWMRAFIDGFFSVGKVYGLDDHTQEQGHFPNFDQPITGILLRSEVVPGWPAMHLNAYPESMAIEDDPTTVETVNILRKSFLSDEVMLVLFDGVPKTLDFYLSPHGLHSGFLRDDTNKDFPRYTHRISHPVTGRELTSRRAIMKVEAISNERGDRSHMVFSPTDLKATFEVQLARYAIRHPLAGIFGKVALSPGHLGMELIKNAPMVRFQLKSSQ